MKNLLTDKQKTSFKIDEKFLAFITSAINGAMVILSSLIAVISNHVGGNTPGSQSASNVFWIISLIIACLILVSWICYRKQRYVTSILVGIIPLVLCFLFDALV